MRTRIAISSLVALTAGFVVSSLIGERPVRGQGSNARTTRARAGLYPAASPYKPTRAGYSRRSGRNRIDAALKRLQAAKTRAEREKSEQALADLLKNEFEADLGRRRAEIDSIQKRIEALKAVLKKRQAARDSIIQLQMKVLTNEAEGLGFPAAAGEPFGAAGSFDSFRPQRRAGSTRTAPAAGAVNPVAR